jgi:hypothetical protein
MADRSDVMANEDVPDDLTRAQASELIDRHRPRRSGPRRL